MAERSSQPPRAAPAGFGTQLRSHREWAGQSQEQLAERSGLSIRTIRNLEGDRIGRPYSDTIRRLADALNLTGQERQDFQGAARGVATTAAGPRAGSATPVPCQLPPDVADFTGRSEQITLVRNLLSGTAADRAPTAVVVSAVAGKAGVGKTALAVHVAHQLRRDFPDGQLYVNLHGATQHSLEAAVVLARFLRALGLDGAMIPADQDERQAPVPGPSSRPAGAGGAGRYGRRGPGPAAAARHTGLRGAGDQPGPARRAGRGAAARP